MIYRVCDFFVVIILSTSTVILFGKVPPSAPVFDNLRDIEDCKGCIVGEENQQFSVFCKTEGVTLPMDVTIAIGNDYLVALEYNLSPGYMAFFILREKHHMENITCTVMNGALTLPLKTTSRLYVIRKPYVKVLTVPETLHEGNDANIECIIEDARPAPAVYFNISGKKVFPSAHNLSIDPVDSYSTHYFSMTTFKREWNQENITCCMFYEWNMTRVECTEPKRVNFLYPPAYITLDITTEPSTPQEMYAVCTLYDSNPIYNVQFTTTSGILSSERYTRYYSLPHDAWKAEYAINLNVSKDDDTVKVLTCDAVSPDLNGSKINMSSTVVVPSYEDATKSMHWFYKWLIWFILGTYCAVSVVSLSVCVAIRKQRRVKELSKNQNAGRACAESLYASIVNQMYETLNGSEHTGGSNVVEDSYTTLNKSTCTGTSNDVVNKTYEKLNKSMCLGGSNVVNEMYETLNNEGSPIYEIVND